MDSLFYGVYLLMILGLLLISAISEDLRVRYRDVFSDIDGYDSIKTISSYNAVLLVAAVFLIPLYGALLLLMVVGAGLG